MRGEIPKQYDPTVVEEKWYRYWEEEKLFHSEPDPKKEPYCIVIPPPNVTDVLHVGHALNNTVQDILIRFKRMCGYETLWMPGTDHAGIATQNVVERNLLNEGVTRHDLGRKEFVERVWQWREEYGSAIINQLKRLGCSCDWDRERFTMDEGSSRAVMEVFVRLYEKGLIYRGEYIVNWCPRCETALSDLEAPSQEQEGQMWYIKYPVVGSDSFISVATTRPETMLGDVAVAVNPKDDRYRDILDRKIRLPIMGREMPVIQDEFVDPEFGTGIVKVTPAHDPNDFDMSKRHGLSAIWVMNGDGTMNENAGKFQGMDRFTCREELVRELESQDLIEKIERHRYAVGRCERCDTVIEPYLSRQWFVKIKPLAEAALQAVEDGRVRFYPEKWTKVYTGWMENIRDWCISRQLWWGHRIPVYRCEACGEVMVQVEPPDRCVECQGERISQDEDVLDTWFSSWLWPFSTLGWPEGTGERKYYYPTNTLVTAYEIIFFWVARMIMAGLEFADNVPFSDVYIHGIVRDDKGKKMSKSVGNTIDPILMIDQFGTDAVRLSLIALAAEGQDIYLSESKFEMGRNFTNKIWNAYRFLKLNMDESLARDRVELEDLYLTELADRWIVSRACETAAHVTSCLESYRLNEAVNTMYHFFWHDYCDWYLELIKERLYHPSSSKDEATALNVALSVMEMAMKLLHPCMPFITEEVWHGIHEGGADSIMISPWFQGDEKLIDSDAVRDMSLIQDVITAVRNIRGEVNMPPSKRVTALLRPVGEDPRQAQEVLETHHDDIAKLSHSSEVTIDRKFTAPERCATAFLPGVEVYVPLGVEDLEKEHQRLAREIEKVEAELARCEGKLLQTEFLEKAPAEVVDREKQKKEQFASAHGKLKDRLALLESYLK